jgi:hypothetical protein
VRAGLWLRWVLLCWIGSLMTGCAGTGPVADDGRAIDDNLLASYRLYGQGERALRPALQRAAQLRDAECDKQWELPFTVATAQGYEGDERLAWLRTLNVDQRLSVIATAEGAGLQIGERLVRVGGVQGVASTALLEALADRREGGRAFEVQTETGKRVVVQPFEVCRGYARLAPPNTPKVQDYHWLMSIHPLELPQAGPSADEVLWAVLWSQGLSEEGGARMKTYHYAVNIGSTLYQLATLASGLKGAALAAEAAVSAAKSAAATVVGDAIKQQLVEQGRQLAMQKIRDSLTDAAERLTRAQVVDMLKASASNRGSLMGVGRVGATVWDRADAWAFERMQRLGADPLAGLRLHQKMVERQLVGNAFLLDAERLAALVAVAERSGLRSQALAAVGGQAVEGWMLQIDTMPLASARDAFRFDSPDDPGARGGRFANGLVDGMLTLPAASSTPLTGSKP